MRQVINYPEKQEDWDNLPEEFKNYLDHLDKIRLEQAVKHSNKDPMYPNYDYCWELDEDLAIQTILHYWNNLDKKLPEPIKILDEINDCFSEHSYDDYASSFYSL